MQGGGEHRCDERARGRADDFEAAGGEGGEGGCRCGGVAEGSQGEGGIVGLWRG